MRNYHTQKKKKLVDRNEKNWVNTFWGKENINRKVKQINCEKF
jgi:hypothetical protein